MNTNTSNMQHQNWEYTSFVSAKGHLAQKNGKTNAHSGTEALDAKMIKKVVAPNKQKTGTNIKQVIESEEMKVDTVSHDFKVALQRARQEKKMTQADLAQKVMEKQAVISEYESGKAIPNTAVISKLERVLGIRLPKQKKN